jgi:hypothetical protein
LDIVPLESPPPGCGCVQKFGKADKIPDGWQVLGLTQDAAVKIFKEEKEAGFRERSRRNLWRR